LRNPLSHSSRAIEKGRCGVCSEREGAGRGGHRGAPCGTSERGLSANADSARSECRECNYDYGRIAAVLTPRHSARLALRCFAGDWRALDAVATLPPSALRRSGRRPVVTARRLRFAAGGNVLGSGRCGSVSDHAGVRANVPDLCHRRHVRRRSGGQRFPPSEPIYISAPGELADGGPVLWSRDKNGHGARGDDPGVCGCVVAGRATPQPFLCRDDATAVRAGCDQPSTAGRNRRARGDPRLPCAKLKSSRRSAG